MAQASRQQVLESVKKCFSTGTYSDLVITCGTDSYKVHKMIVCTRADFFARAIRFGGKEASENAIDLPEDEPAMVKLLIQYLYEGEYDPLLPDKADSEEESAAQTAQFEVIRTDIPDGYLGVPYNYSFPHSCRLKHLKMVKLIRCPNPYVCPHHQCERHCGSECQDFICSQCTIPIHNEPADQLLTHTKMYELADKYDVMGLKDLVQKKFKCACAMFWNTEAFPIAANHAYSTTLAQDRGLRDIVSDTISEHMELIRKPTVQALMAECNGLSLGIMLKKADEYGW